MKCMILKTSKKKGRHGTRAFIHGVLRGGPPARRCARPRGVPPRSMASEDVIRQLLKQVHTSGTFPEKTSEVVQVKRSDSQRKHVCARRGYIYKTHIIYHTKYIIYDSCNCNFSHIITSVCMCVYIYIISYIIIISVITIIYCNNYGS